MVRVVLLQENVVHVILHLERVVKIAVIILDIRIICYLKHVVFEVQIQFPRTHFVATFHKKEVSLGLSNLCPGSSKSTKKTQHFRTSKIIKAKHVANEHIRQFGKTRIDKFPCKKGSEKFSDDKFEIQGDKLEIQGHKLEIAGQK